MRENAFGIHFPDYRVDLRAHRGSLLGLGFFLGFLLVFPPLPQPLPFPVPASLSRMGELGAETRSREADPDDLSGAVEMRQRIPAEWGHGPACSLGFS